MCLARPKKAPATVIKHIVQPGACGGREQQEVLRPVLKRIHIELASSTIGVKHHGNHQSYVDYGIEMDTDV